MPVLADRLGDRESSPVLQDILANQQLKQPPPRFQPAHETSGIGGIRGKKEKGKEKGKKEGEGEKICKKREISACISARCVDRW